MLAHFQTIWTVTEAENQLITDQAIYIKRQPAQWGFILTGLPSLARQSVWGELHPISVMSVFIKYQALSAGNAYGLWHQHQERESILNQDPDEANDEKYNNHKYTALLPFEWSTIIHIFKKMSAIASMGGQIVLN